MRRIISYEKARRIVVSSFEEMEKEEIPLQESLGRIAACDIKTSMDSPPFDRSAVDGFACHGKDVMHASSFNPSVLALRGSTMAGEVFEGKVKRGQCVEIATGAAIPQGCDCVVMKEYARKEDGNLIIEERGHPFLNVSRRGEDVKKGEVIIGKGRMLQPQDLGILKSCGIRRITVRRKPRMGIIITGSELASDILKLEKGKIIESNSLMIASLSEKCGAHSSFSTIAKDERDIIEKAIRRARRKSDLILVTGGSSVGKKDLVVEIVRPLFSGVAMRPGRPFGFLPPLFIMSGYPVACLMQFYVFVIPVLEKMLGTRIQKYVYGILQEKIASEVGRRDFVRVRLEEEKVYPVALKGSGIISSAVLSDGFVVVEENREGLESGEKVRVFLWI